MLKEKCPSDPEGSMDIGEQPDGSFIRSGTVKLVAVEIPEIDLIEVEKIVPISAMVTPSDVNGVCEDERYYWWASSNIRFLVNGQEMTEACGRTVNIIAKGPSDYLDSSYVGVLFITGQDDLGHYRWVLSPIEHFTAVEIDLDVDSNNNGLVGDWGEDEGEMEWPGMVVGIGGAVRPGMIHQIQPLDVPEGQVYLRAISGSALLHIYNQNGGQLLYSTNKARSNNLWNLLLVAPIHLDIVAPQEPEQIPGEIVLQVEYCQGFRCVPDAHFPAGLRRSEKDSDPAKGHHPISPLSPAGAIQADGASRAMNDF